MTRRKSMQTLVNPLRKLSLLTSSSNLNTYRPDLEFVPEVVLTDPLNHEQKDMLTLFPREIMLKIISLLSFQDLIRVQLTCRIWRRFAQDASIWRSRLNDLNSRFTDIYAHQPLKSIEANALPWKTRYCQAITCANWRMGSVQNLVKLDDNESSRMLSVKLRQHMLVTLAEDNSVKLYTYSTDTGFTFKAKWSFGDQPAVECVDVLPDINILVVAQRGSKCMFYDINKGSKHDPIQVLKGGSHPWFVPDSIAVNQDYFAVSGRKPSAVFVWNWRKGVRLSNKAFDNQPHNVFISGEHLITMSVDGLLNVFDIFDSNIEPTFTHQLNPCSIPCVEYDNSLSIVLAPHSSRRVHHYRWTATEVTTPSLSASISSSDNESDDTTIQPIPSSSVPITHSTKRRLSNTFNHLLGRKQCTKDTIPIPTKSMSSNTVSTSRRSSTATLLKKSSHEFYKSVRIRRHSSYNDYGYACQMKTDQYIKQIKTQQQPLPLPNFHTMPQLVHSIRTTPLGSAAKEIVNVTIYKDRVATVNKSGDISLYALNGTTAARVTLVLGQEKQEWMNDTDTRDDDDLSDGYDFMRSRLAMGTMGLIYGCKNGNLWWLDFGCRSTAT